MLFFIIPVSNDDLDKSSKKEFLCELYNYVKFPLSNKFNLKTVYILLSRKSYYLTLSRCLPWLPCLQGTQLCILSSRQGTLLKLPGI